MLVRAATKTGAFNVIGKCSRYAIERWEQAMADFTSDPHGNTTGPAPSLEATDVGGHKRRARPSRHVCSVCGREVPAR